MSDTKPDLEQAEPATSIHSVDLDAIEARLLRVIQSAPVEYRWTSTDDMGALVESDAPALVAYARALEAALKFKQGLIEDIGATCSRAEANAEHWSYVAEAAEAERDRARATAVHLEQELAQIRQRTEES